MATQPPSPSHTSPSPTTSSKHSKFRFKSNRPRSASPLDPQSKSRHSSSRNHRHHHHHHRSHHRPRRPPSPAPPPLSPNVAFRESLFDALADDEGAAFWEGVYGQPIHTYSPYASRSGAGEGELERMDDEEYVAYVRAKMWEKSHEYLIEERSRRREQRKQEQKKKEEGKVWERGLEETLRRGEDRRRRSRWKQCWEKYLESWENSNKPFERGNIGGQMCWPVESGRWEDVGIDEVEIFFKNAPQPIKSEPKVNFGAIIKAERVRWHPDKVQQRFGSQGIDDETMKMVTAVFQIIDRIWSAEREN